ncbi:MAG: hypothetical protein LBT86_09155 [Deltaproteobacteria bacterium]|jgi:hypothetical protein|nr:hypothetical protein [Deltaproteobacteria bacterium]
MTAPLHHINQLYLHLPTINGQVAAQAAIGQDLQRIAQLAHDRDYRRDLVEVVSETNPGSETVGIRREGEPLSKSFIKGKNRFRRGKAAGRSQTSSGDLLVDVRV